MASEEEFSGISRNDGKATQTQTTTPTTTAEKEKPQLSAKELADRQEIVIDISFKGLRRFYLDLFDKWPREIYKNLMRGVEKVSQPMMTGKAAVVSLPVGIMLRNGSRSGYHISKGDYGGDAFKWLGGLAGFGVTAYFGFYALQGVLGTGLLATIGAGAGAAIAGGLVAIPAATVVGLAAATAIGGAITVLSIAPGLVNIGKGWKRSKDAFKGIEYDAATLDRMRNEMEKDSINREYERDHFENAYSNLRGMGPKYRAELFKSLKEEFAAAADNAPADEKDTSNKKMYTSTFGNRK